MPRVTIPLEARVTEHDIDVQILHLAFDMKLGNTLVGQGEIGPYTYLRTDYLYLPITATCPRAALPYLLNPPPPQGRITVTLGLRGLLSYRHSYQAEDERSQGLDEPGVWHTESLGNQSIQELDVQVARSDWYEQVVAPLGIGGYLVTPLYLPYGVKTWEATLGHMNDAQREVAQGNPPGVFSGCRAAIDALPGNKTGIFDAMPAGKKRDAIDQLTKEIGNYIHSGMLFQIMAASRPAIFR